MPRPVGDELPGTKDAPINSDRRAAVDTYIQKELQRTGTRITRTAIWKSAGYKSRTEFERWERGDSRATKAADRNFTRILRQDAAAKATFPAYPRVSTH